MSYSFGVAGCGHSCSDCAVVKMFMRKFLTEEKPALEAEVKTLREKNTELEAEVRTLRKMIVQHENSQGSGVQI